MKYVTNPNTGERLCLHCKLSNDCICLPEKNEKDEPVYTRLYFSSCIPSSRGATRYALKKQKLPNGRVIPSQFEIWIPYHYAIEHLGRKIIDVDNSFINRMTF